MRANYSFEKKIPFEDNEAAFKRYKSQYSIQTIPIDDGGSPEHLGGQHFRTDAEFRQDILTWLHKRDTDFYDAVFDGFVYRWNKCLYKYGVEQ
ncbi:hypothetical protein TNCV_78281 [Trichonephila clavipes]|nr:hypothetical protein TNCV_78281 [Trichonephila clavipes]